MGLFIALCFMLFIVSVAGLVAHCTTKSSKVAQGKKPEKKIVEVKLLGAGSTDFRSFGGAVVGGLIAGPVGAVIGGTQGGKGKPRYRVAIKYSDGSVKIKEVHADSELMKYVSWEDI